MADNQTPRYPVILVTDVGAYEQGMVTIHDEATGQTIQADREMYLLSIKDLNKPQQ